ncbi:MAG: DUF6530 family protein [Paludibacter sp.]
MEAPIDLKHKPIIVVNDYKQVEPYPESTDAMALSIGFAQWSTDVRELSDKDISVKIFRKGQDDQNSAWSRQSEEVPLYRILDMAIFTLLTFIGNHEEFPLKDLKIKVIDEENVKYIEQYFEQFKKYPGNNSLLLQIKELEILINKFNQKYDLP